MILAKKQLAYQRYCEVKLINMNILKEKKYYVLIKVELQNKVSLHILLSGKHLEDKYKQLKDEKQIKATEEHVKQLAESNAHIRKQEYDKKDLFNL